MNVKVPNVMPNRYNPFGIISDEKNPDIISLPSCGLEAFLHHLN
ncbi:MAG: hypothetical protein ACPKPY_03525 [Nitrososphaeraceae archaeon]